MVILGGWLFLMSEVPLYPTTVDMHQALAPERLVWLETRPFFFFSITLKPRVE